VDYAGYKQWREKVGAVGPDLLRLDCMNPVQALASWLKGPLLESRRTPASETDAITAWTAATGLSLDRRTTVLGTGVRDLLGACFARIVKIAGGDGELWLPSDVYPRYRELASAQGLTPRAFSTLSPARWSFLGRAGPAAVALLPFPLSPLGRWPTAPEIESLVGWLRDAGDRALLIDAVYTYDFAASAAVMAPLLASSRPVAALWSCSKSWLQRGVLGIARAPESWVSSMRQAVSSLSPVDLGEAVQLLHARSSLPEQQEQAFQRQWRRLAARIRSAVPDWQPPATGYFSTINRPFQSLLAQHDILAIPASVFGSRDDSRSIITCLYDLASDERAGTA
jgi:aspartate/methionine/tyrosine aminotransferase